MSWWTKALYDTCSLITLDKLLLDRPGLSSQFPKGILALEESLSEGQMEKETALRIQGRVTLSPLPDELRAILASAQLSKVLSNIDGLVFATAVKASLAVVTADKRLAKSVRNK